MIWPWFAAMMPLSAVVFALDGVLIGAGDLAFLRNLTLVAGAARVLPDDLALARAALGSDGHLGRADAVRGGTADRDRCSHPARTVGRDGCDAGLTVGTDKLIGVCAAKRSSPDDPAGLIVVDKPGGMTSHDVVSRVRRLARTRRVGHGGTLDPMATGVLVIGVGRATRLLTYVIGRRQALRGDDPARRVDHHRRRRGRGGRARRPPPALTDDGDPGRARRSDRRPISQVPSAVSAIKINGQRAYAQGARRRVRRAGRAYGDDFRDRRAGHPAFVRRASRPWSTSTSRWPARPGRTSGRSPATSAPSLGVGGHLTALRRTAVGGFTLAESVTLDALTDRSTRAARRSRCRWTMRRHGSSLDGTRRRTRRSCCPTAVRLPRSARRAVRGVRARRLGDRDRDGARRQDPRRGGLRPA